MNHRLEPSASANPWDEFAAEYGDWVARREQEDLERDPIITQMLALLGDVTGKRVLDACCGEGFFSGILNSRGALVTGIDLSPRLIDMARRKDPRGTIEYRVGDLSRPLPEFDASFDLIASHMALNDVQDCRGFAANLPHLAKPEARVVLAFNNPYSMVVRGHVTDYFASGSLGVYGGFSQVGMTATYFHRTLEDYVDAFLESGLRLTKLVDVPSRSAREWLLPEECRFPLFMIVAFEVP